MQCLSRIVLINAWMSYGRFISAQTPLQIRSTVVSPANIVWKKFTNLSYKVMNMMDRSWRKSWFETSFSKLVLFSISTMNGIFRVWLNNRDVVDAWTCQEESLGSQPNQSRRSILLSNHPTVMILVYSWRFRYWSTKIHQQYWTNVFSLLNDRRLVKSRSSNHRPHVQILPTQSTKRSLVRDAVLYSTVD